MKSVVPPNPTVRVPIPTERSAQLPPAPPFGQLFDNIPVSPYCLLVKTTIDFPEHLLHRAKTIAVQRKITLKELVIQGLEHAIRQPAVDVDAERKARAAALIAALSAGKNTDPIGPLNRDEIYDRQQGKWD